MVSAVAGEVILSLWQIAKNPKSANTDDNSILSIATVFTTVANNSAPDIFLVSSLELRRLINM